MIIEATFVDTLVWYDGPRVIQIQDRSGGIYIGTANHNGYACVVITPERLASLLSGRVDLLSVYTQAAEHELFKAAIYDFEIPFTLENASFEDDDLPDPGLYLNHHS